MTTTLRDQFLGWQCRLRQISVRNKDGRPEPGMRPRVADNAGHEMSPGITVLILHDDPAESADLFRHIVKRTHDPRQRREDALKLLSSTHYQVPARFSDRLTASFEAGSNLADALVAQTECRLEFSQFGQSFTLPCRVEELTASDAAWQTTFWHNHMFNPHLSGDARILAFNPDWTCATATGFGD